MQSTSKFYNSLLSYTPNVNVLQLSSILYNKLPSFTTPYYLILAISKIYNSLLSYTIKFGVLQLSTILYNQLRRFTTLYYLMQSTSTFYNYLLSYTTKRFTTSTIFAPNF